MKYLPATILLLLCLLFSCSGNGLRGVKCSNGKAKKVKTVRLKKLRAYQRGVGGGGGIAPVRASSPSTQEDNQQQAANNADQVEPTEPEPTILEQDSIDVLLMTVDTNTPTQISPDPSPRDTIYRATIERRTLPPNQNSPDTIYRTSVERRGPPTTNTDSPADTIYRTTVERRSPDSPSTPDTLFRQTTIRQADVPELSSIELDTEIDLDQTVNIKPIKTVIYKGELFEFEEDVTFNERIYFIPNYDVFLNDRRANKKLKDLANLLLANPSVSVTIQANAGWDNPFESMAPKYTENPETGEVFEIHYGTDPEVYSQTIYSLGLPVDSYEESRILYLGIELVDKAVIGDLLEARNQTLKKELIELGVPSSQIFTRLGAFEKMNKHDVDFIVE